MRTTIAKLKKKSIGWWTSIATIAALIVALVAWLLPEPLKTRSIPTPQPTTIAQSLGITGTVPFRKPGTIRILVARFDEADQSEYRVTELVLTKLRSSMSTYPDTEVVSTDYKITEQEGSEIAIQVGQAYNANIVIWGWYGLTEQAVPFGIHFETIPNSDAFDEAVPGTCTTVSASQIRKANPSDLNNLTLQTNLSNELSYVTMFTVGLTRFGVKDWNGSIAMFTDAIEYLDENTILSAKTWGNGVLVDTDILYYYRAKANLESDNIDAALDDITKIRGTVVNDPVFQYTLGKIYQQKQDYQAAINHFTLAINKQPSPDLSAILYYLRGRAFNSISQFESAENDFQIAFKLDGRTVTEYIIENIPPDDKLSYANGFVNENPMNSVAYYVRGLVYKDLGNPSDALKDYDKAIEINHDFLIARVARADLLDFSDGLYDPKMIIEDREISFRSQEYQTPCNLLGTALAYHKSGDEENALKYFEQTIKTTTLEINSDPANGHAYILRALALESEGKHLAALRDFWAAKKVSTSEKDRGSADKGIELEYEYFIRQAALAIVGITAIGILLKLTYRQFKNRRIHHRRRRHAH